MTPWGQRILTIYSLLLVGFFMVHNMVKAYKGKEECSSLVKLILLIPTFIFLSNIIK